MDQHVTAHNADRVVELLRQTLRIKAADLELPSELEPVSAPSPRRPWMTIAACVVVAVGAGSLLGYRASAPADRQQAVGTGPSPAEAASAQDVQWYLPGEIPPGYALTDLRATPSDGTVQLSLSPTGRGVGMLVVVGPTDPSIDLGESSDVETIDGTSYSIAQGDLTVSVTSIQGDVTLQVINAYDRETALGVATDIRPVSLDEARRAAAAIDERLRGYAEVAAATLGDGTTATVRRADGTDDVAVALCIDGATPTCQQPPADADPGAPAHVAATFDSGPGRRIVAWHETEGDLEFVGRTDGEEPGERLPTELVPATRGEGWFASTRLPAGDDRTIVAMSVGAAEGIGYVFPVGGVNPR